MASKERQPARVEQRITPPDVLAHRNELVRGLDERAGELAEKYLLPESKLWFPDKFIPQTFEGKIDLRDREGVWVPRLLAVVLVGNGITEDGLPMFETMVNRAEGMADHTGADDTGHARWSRGWTAEERRHGQVIRSYLECVPVVDLAAVDRIQHRYIAGGFDPGIGHDPYRLVVYPAMQEPGTETPHKRTGHAARTHDLPVLARTSIQVGSDEGRHGSFYADMGSEIIAVDPEGFVNEYHYIALERKMVMPGKNMEGFDVFMNAAIAMDVYGPPDYVKIGADLNKRWGLEHLSLSGEADRKRTELLEHFTQEKADWLRERQWGRKAAVKALLGAHISWLKDPVITQADLAEVGLAA